MQQLRVSFAAAAAVVLCASAAAVGLHVHSGVGTGTSSGANCGVGWTGEFLLVYDVSSSFDDDVHTLRVLAPSLFQQLADKFPGATFALATFKDKPQYPLGSKGDHCYRKEVGFTTDWQQIVDKFGIITASGGHDFPESQLDALFHGASSTQLGWTSGATRLVGNHIRPVLRVIILATDDAYHMAGDAYYANDSYVPHLGQSEAECDVYDYPSVEQVHGALVKRNAHVLFLVTDGFFTVYESLLDSLNYVSNDAVLGNVQHLATDSSNVVAAISKGVSDITCQVEAQPTTTTPKPTTTTPKPTTTTPKPTTTTPKPTTTTPKPTTTTPKPTTTTPKPTTTTPKPTTTTPKPTTTTPKPTTTTPKPTTTTPKPTAAPEKAVNEIPKPPVKEETEETTTTTTTTKTSTSGPPPGSKMYLLVAAGGAIAVVALAGGGYAVYNMVNGELEPMEAEFQDDDLVDLLGDDDGYEADREGVVEMDETAYDEYDE